MLFDHFTDRSRKVMAFANQEAQRLNQDYLGTEHILIGLAREGFGVAAHILIDTVDVKRLRIEVERLVKIGPMQAMGNLPHSPRVKDLIDRANATAKEWKHEHIGTEHLLYALVLDTQSVAYQALINCKVDIDDIKKQIIELVCDKDEQIGTTGVVRDKKTVGKIEIKAKTINQEELFHELVLTLAKNKEYDILAKVLSNREYFLRAE